MTPERAAALQEHRPFASGKNLRGKPVTPYSKTTDYARAARGSAVRIFAGALSEHGTAGVIGTTPLLPPLGELDPAPAMAMALPEASYIVWSYETPIAWFLGPEVYGSPATGQWIEVAEVCNREYSWFSRATTRHQNEVHRAITGQGDTA